MTGKKVKGPYYFFMLEIQDQLQRQTGRRLTLDAVKEIASPKWNALSKEDRVKYQEMAKNEKKKPATNNDKLASDGIRLSEIERMNREKENEEKEIILTVQRRVREAFRDDTLTKIPFHVLNFVGICKNAKLPEIPREVGLAVFTLKEGVKDEYHRFIKPSKIPTGYASKVKDTTDQYHGIPTLDFEEDTTNYIEVYEAIVKKVRPGRTQNGKCIVFCKRDDLPLNKQCLEWLYNSSSCMEPNNIHFADLSNLVAEFRSVVGQPFHTRTIIDDGLSRPTYDYYTGVRCEFHETIDNCNCALGFSKRSCYLMSEMVIDYFDVEITKQHIPLLSNDAVQLVEERPAPSIKIRQPIRPLPEQEPEAPKQQFVQPKNVWGRRQDPSSGLENEIADLRINRPVERGDNTSDLQMSDFPPLRQPTTVPKSFEHSMMTTGKSVGIGRGKRNT